MSREKYVVQLTARESLQKFVRGGTSSALRARILLKADDSWTVHRIAEALDVSPGTVCRIKRRFCEVGLQPLKDANDPDGIADSDQAGDQPQQGADGRVQRQAWCASTSPLA